MGNEEEREAESHASRRVVKEVVRTEAAFQ